MSEDGDEILKVMGEAGAIGVVVLGVLGSIIKLIQRNGCTCRMNSCQGKPLVGVDCENGAPTPRFNVTKNDTELTETSSV
jgi:hypothetical protein